MMVTLGDVIYCLCCNEPKQCKHMLFTVVAQIVYLLLKQQMLAMWFLCVALQYPISTTKHSNHTFCAL